MPPSPLRGILLDIEGTTSSISFVYDVMFPFVRRELEAYLTNHWGEPELTAACEAIARDAGNTSLSASRDSIQAEVIRLMDGDVKTTGLKQLQGLIWDAGFKSGEMKAHVYDDVPPAIAAWNSAGLDVRIYSSGSVQAQKLFFGHTIAGNLLPLFRTITTLPLAPNGKRLAIPPSLLLSAFRRVRSCSSATSPPNWMPPGRRVCKRVSSSAPAMPR